MARKRLPQTSIDAYHSLDPELLTDRYKKILMSLSVLGEATSEEIAAHAKLDNSKVWKRMSELEKDEYGAMVYKPGNKRQLKSGRFGYTYMLTAAATPKTIAEKNIYKSKEKTAGDYASNLINKSFNAPTLFP